MLLEAEIRKLLVSGEQWGEWHGYHIPVSDQYIVIWSPIGTTMHWVPGTWISRSHSLSFFWPESWYVLHIGYDETGNFVSGYCDIVLPTAHYTNTSTEMIYVDLYVDVVIREDHSVYTKDQEVFDWAAKHFPIVEQSRQKSFEVLDWLEQQAIQWSGPFSVVPRQLPRTDFETLHADESGALLRSLIVH